MIIPPQLRRLSYRLRWLVWFVAAPRVGEPHYVAKRDAWLRREPARPSSARWHDEHYAR